MKTSLSSIFALLFLMTISAACGVRGRPQPPLEPAFIGRGQPSFKRVTEEYKFPEVPSPEAPKGSKERPAKKPPSRGSGGGL